MGGPDIRQYGSLFLDAKGRQVMLRGVNLGGDSKTPWPNGGTQHPSDFADHRDVSFIGRPFPLEDAAEHLARLSHWGFNTLRLLTSWEAVEHRGPGEYDTEYLDYFTEICRRAGEYDLHVFIDFHQDAWSRMSGGDGAPGWTFEAVGLDFTRFDEAQAAHVMQARYDYSDPTPRQAAYPQMSWGSNYRLPANGIMWSLFWGGRLLTPAFEIAGENVQDFLQHRYLGAMDQVARRLAGLPNVMGFDTLNEPNGGWIGQPLSYRHLAACAEHPERPRIGPALAPLDSLAMAQGLPVSVPVLTRDPSGAAVPTETRTFNGRAVRIWRDDVDCPFERAGAYRVDGTSVVPLAETFFEVAEGRLLSPRADGYGPFFRQVAATIRRREPAWSVFAEMDAFALATGYRFPDGLPERSVNASHWYDVATLYLKAFDATGREDALAERFERELRGLASAANDFLGGSPSLVGEFGIPFDLHHGEAYAAWARGERNGVWDPHITALSLMYDAMDALGLHSAQWNYTATNRNDPRIGDGWNQEDLSIFSLDQQVEPADPNSGGRAVEGFCRPYARRVQGRIGAVRFDRRTRSFRLDFAADAEIDAPTDIYVPRIQFPEGFIVRFEGVPAEITPLDAQQRVCVLALASGPAWLSLEPPRPGD